MCGFGITLAVTFNKIHEVHVVSVVGKALRDTRWLTSYEHLSPCNYLIDRDAEFAAVKFSSICTYGEIGISSGIRRKFSWRFIIVMIFSRSAQLVLDWPQNLP